MIRDTIIRKIVELDVAGHRLAEESIRETNELLYEAALNEFGSWQTALDYAGVRARDVGRSREQTAERVKQRLRRLCTTGYDLGAHLNRERDRDLYYAALHHFGTWRSALTASGINLSNVTNKTTKHLNRATMLLWLQCRKAEGKTVMYRDVCLENRLYALAIRREFGSWIKAMKEAFPSEDDEKKLE
jgi:hypothetical protein